MIGWLTGTLARLDANPYLSAIRAGMVAVVPLTIAGGLFMIVANLPVPGWEARIAPYLPLLQIPVSATFGVLAIVACLAIAYELGRRFGQDAFASASIALVVLLLISIDPGTGTFAPDSLGSRGLFTAILVAVVCVRTQKVFTDHELVIRMPAGVPAMVRESFLSLVPLCVLIALFWLIRFAAGLPLDSRFENGNGKRVLRTLARRLLPPEISERRKHGFSVPIEDWLRGPLDSLVGDVIASPGSGLFRRDVLKRWHDEHRRQRDRSGPLWAALVWELWWRELGSAAPDDIASAGRPLAEVR